MKLVKRITHVIQIKKKKKRKKRKVLSALQMYEFYSRRGLVSCHYTANEITVIIRVLYINVKLNIYEVVQDSGILNN
jgi:hypothetical protein